MKEIIKRRYNTKVIIYLSMGVVDFDGLKIRKKKVMNTVKGNFLSMKCTFWAFFNLFMLKC